MIKYIYHEFNGDIYYFSSKRNISHFNFGYWIHKSSRINKIQGRYGIEMDIHNKK